MTDIVANFHLVSDGYDPAEVDRRVAELVQATKIAQQHAHDLRTQVGDLGAQVASVLSERDAAFADRAAALAAVTAAEVARDAAIAEAKAVRAAVPPPGATPDFASLGEHVGTLLQAATDAASRIRSDGLDEIAAARATVQREIESRLNAAQKQLAELTRHRDEVIAHLTHMRDALKPAEPAEGDQPQPLWGTDAAAE